MHGAARVNTINDVGSISTGIIIIMADFVLAELDHLERIIEQFGEQAPEERLFLPLTLEMGSWLWLRKNPLHLFSRHGLFHPILPHRRQRIYRRHFLLFDFLHRSLLYPIGWTCLSEAHKHLNTQKAMEMWYA
jgi:hypothetical protein